MNRQIKYTAKSQQGAALVVSLMILLVMTLIGITAMSSSNLEEKMAGNSRDMMLAFQAADIYQVQAFRGYGMEKKWSPTW